jgi:pimeloyl-ACP methyl ester carboxylesterase
LGPLWQTRRDFWADRAGNETALRANFLSRTATRKRHLGTSPNVSLYNPDLWTDEFAFLSRPGQSDIQMGLFYNYRTNVASYPTWRRAFAATSRRSSYFWGRFDPSFQVEEAEAFGRDVPSAQIHILDAGHFALDEQPDLVAHLTRQFLLSAPIRWTGRHAALVSGSPQMTQICVISGNCVACSSAK